MKAYGNLLLPGWSSCPGHVLSSISALSIKDRVFFKMGDKHLTSKSIDAHNLTTVVVLRKEHVT
jgi:hypothetical protein